MYVFIICSKVVSECIKIDLYLNTAQFLPEDSGWCSLGYLWLGIMDEGHTVEVVEAASLKTSDLESCYLMYSPNVKVRLSLILDLWGWTSTLMQRDMAPVFQPPLLGIWFPSEWLDRMLCRCSSLSRSVVIFHVGRGRAHDMYWMLDKTKEW